MACMGSSTNSVTIVEDFDTRPSYVKKSFNDKEGIQNPKISVFRFNSPPRSTNNSSSRVNCIKKKQEEGTSKTVQEDRGTSKTVPEKKQLKKISVFQYSPGRDNSSRKLYGLVALNSSHQNPPKKISIFQHSPRRDESCRQVKGFVASTYSPQNPPKKISVFKYSPRHNVDNPSRKSKKTSIFGFNSKKEQKEGIEMATEVQKQKRNKSTVSFGLIRLPMRRPQKNIVEK